MNAVPKFWAAVEALFPVYADVRVGWRRRLGDEYDLVAPLLRPDGTLSSVYPCPYQWGCLSNHEVVEHGEDCFSAVPDEDSRGRCRVARNLRRGDVIRRDIDMPSVWDCVAAALGVAPVGSQFPANEPVFQLGRWNNLPVHVVITRERLELLHVVQHLALQSLEPFVLVAPTDRSYCAKADAVMRMRKAIFLPLSEHAGFDRRGTWTAKAIRVDAPVNDAVREVHDGPVHAQPENVFRCDGATWTICFAGNSVHLPDNKGFRYIIVLLREPGRVWSVEDLLVAVGNGSNAPVLGGDAGPVLDQKAVQQYRARLKEVEEEIEDAQFLHDVKRLEELMTEKKMLRGEVLSAVSREGSIRMGAKEAEKAADAVSKAIRRAIDIIGTKHEGLSRHLSTSIRRGYNVSYEPSEPTDWQTN